MVREMSTQINWLWSAASGAGRIMWQSALVVKKKKKKHDSVAMDHICYFLESEDN